MNKMVDTAKGPFSLPPMAFSVPKRNKNLVVVKEEKEEEEEEKKSICWPMVPPSVIMGKKANNGVSAQTHSPHFV